MSEALQGPVCEILVRLYGDVYVRSARSRHNNLKTFHDRSPYRLVIVEPLYMRVVPIHGRDELYAPYVGVCFQMHGFLAVPSTLVLRDSSAVLVHSVYEDGLLNEAGLRR